MKRRKLDCCTHHKERTDRTPWHISVTATSVEQLDDFVSQIKSRIADGSVGGTDAIGGGRYWFQFDPLDEENKWRNEEDRLLFWAAENNAKRVLKIGDRLRVTKCDGTKRSITFACWNGPWIVSKSGGDDYSPRSVDRLNGERVDFTKPANDSLRDEPR